MNFNNFALEQLALQKRGADIGLRSYLSTHFKNWFIDNIKYLDMTILPNHQNLRTTRMFYDSGMKLNVDLIHNFDWSSNIMATFEYSVKNPDVFTISFVCRNTDAFEELFKFLSSGK